MMNRLPRWLRWVLVIPIAAFAWVAVSLGVPILFTVFELLGVQKNPIASLMGDYLPQVLAAIAAPYGFVWCGVYTAPARRAAVAVALATVMALPYLAATVLLTAHTRDAKWWFVLANLISACAAIAAGAKLRSSAGVG